MPTLIQVLIALPFPPPLLLLLTVGPFFKDLKDERYTTPFAIYHRRFSTNTVPKWPLAQPMRVLGHNGARTPPLAAPAKAPWQRSGGAGG